MLRARRAADDARLGKLLRDALPGRGRDAVGVSMTVERSPLLPRLVLHVQPADVRTTDSAESLGATTASVAALVLLVDPGTRTRVDAGLVAETFHLTRAESQVAAVLAEGSTVRAIARATHRKESTVRWLVKQIHAKCGITRQADLVRMVASAAPSLSEMQSTPVDFRRSPRDLSANCIHHDESGAKRTLIGPWFHRRRASTVLFRSVRCLGQHMTAKHHSRCLHDDPALSTESPPKMGGNHMDQSL